MKVKEADMTCRHSTCGFRNKKLVRNTLLALCEHLRQRYGHTLPRSTPRLLEKIRCIQTVWLSGTCEWKIRVTSPPAKVGMREGRLLLKLKRSKFPVYTDMQIFEEYKPAGENKRAEPD
mgnify:CR=1 FL=1